MARSSREPSRIPVRGAAGLALTAGGLAILLSLRPADPSEATGTPAQPTPTPPGEASTGASPGASPVASGAWPSGLVLPSAPVLASASPSASPLASAPASPSDTAAPTATPAQAVTVTGEAIRFRWGTVQVAVTVQDGRIVDVRALSLPSGDRHSSSLSQRSEPILREEALTAQSAAIDGVSGATYTSRAYALSLQSALDQLAG